MSTTEADYIIVGGGLTGCTLAARLHQRNPSLIIIIIEAGRDASDNPNASSPLGSFALTGSDLDWAYPSLPDATTNNRVHINNAGKALGGGSTSNQPFSLSLHSVFGTLQCWVSRSVSYHREHDTNNI